MTKALMATYTVPYILYFSHSPPTAKARLLLAILPLQTIRLTNGLGINDFDFFCNVNKESKCFLVATDLDCCSDRSIYSLLFMLTELHSTALFKRKKTFMGLLKQHYWLWFIVWYRCLNCNQTNEINFCFIEQTLHLCKPLCYINVKLNSVESNKTFLHVTWILRFPKCEQVNKWIRHIGFRSSQGRLRQLPSAGNSAVVPSSSRET